MGKEIAITLKWASMQENLSSGFANNCDQCLCYSLFRKYLNMIQVKF